MSERITIARPYAKAIFEYAAENDKLKEWENMLQIAAVIVTEPKIEAELVKPKRSAEQRADIVNNIAQKHFTEPMQNLIKLLAKNKRLALLPEMTKLFENYRAEKEKRLQVKVVSAMPIEENQQAQLQSALKQRYQYDIQIEIQEEPSLIGGAILHVGNQVIDGSLKTQLKRLHEQLQMR